MENLARLSGDVEAEVAIHVKNISSGYDYLKIAELYALHKNSDKAVEWAEKGLKSFSKQPDGRLRKFLAKEYHRLERHDEAMALIWGEFVDNPSLDNFKSLKTHAEITTSWPEWRNKCLEHIHLGIQKAKVAKPRSYNSTDYLWEQSRNSSTLVELYLWEKDANAAWKQAQTDGANTQLWHQLAEMREKTHPADAAAAYRKIVFETVSRGDNDSYREAVKLLGKIQSLMKEAKVQDRFSVYLEEVRATFKSKRNFIKLLDAKF